MTVFESITIDPEFKALIPPLSGEERDQLEANIRAEGCRDALVVWAPEPFCETTTLLDGHNRFEICQKHDREFAVKRLGAEDIPDRQAAINWIINNQLGRRNLHPDQQSYLRGKRYNGEKLTFAEAGAKRATSLDQNDPSSESTADRLATEFKVSPATVKRDGQYAAAVDKLAKAGIEPQAVIAHEPKSAVVALAKALTPEPDPPSTPLFPSEPVKPQAPIVAAVTEMVKAGEMTVLQAAKAIERDQQETFVKELRERQSALAKPTPREPAPVPVDPVFETILPNGRKIANGDPKALWLWGWLLEYEDRFGKAPPDPETLASNFLEFMERDSRRLIPAITQYLNALLGVIHVNAA